MQRQGTTYLHPVEERCLGARHPWNIADEEREEPDTKSFHALYAALELDEQPSQIEEHLAIDVVGSRAVFVVEQLHRPLR